MNQEHNPLTEERIADMRANVMNRIDQPRRRSTRWLPMAAAAAVITVLGSTGIGYLAGSQNYGAETMAASDSNIGGAQLDSQSRFTVPNNRDTGGSDSQDSAPTESGQLQPEVTEPGVEAPTTTAPNANSPEHIIVTGHVAVTVQDASDSRDEIRSHVDKLGGWLDADSMSNYGETSVHITVRIPTTKVDEFTDFLADIGKVTDTSIHRAQVDQQVQDLDARIEALKVSTDRLRTIMNEAANTRDLLEAEARLAERQAELESLQAQRKGLADRTAMATIEVHLSTSTPAEAVNPGGFLGGLIAGWNAFVSLVNMTVTGFGFLLPWLVPIALVAFGLRWLIRRRRQNRGA